MILIGLSDEHLTNRQPANRLDSRELRDVQMRKLRYVMERAVKESALPVVLSAGDLFDGPRSWHLAEEYMRLFRWFAVEEGGRFFVVFGQHDTYLYNEAARQATGLGVLLASGYVELLGDSPQKIQSSSGGPTAIYGASFGQRIPEVTKKQTAYNILVVHRSIVPHKLWASQEGYDYGPEFLNVHKDFDLIVAGDIHRTFHFIAGKKGHRRHLINSGPMLRLEASEYNYNEHKPGFWLIDTEDRQAWFEEIPHKPGPEVLEREGLERAKKRTLMMDEFYEAFESLEEEGEEWQPEIEKVIRRIVEKEQPTEGVKALLAQAMEEKAE